MREALVNGIKQEAVKGAKGICLCCGCEVVAKCGKVRCHHWAHKNKEECNYSQKEPKTQWHINWQNQFPKEWQEVRCVDEKTGDIHIADIKTPRGLVVEFQHSAIAPEECLAREQYYRDMIWVVDGERSKKMHKNAIDLADTICKILWSASLGIHDVIKGCETIHGQDNKKIKLFTCSKAEQFFPNEWLNMSVPVFFDFNIFEKRREGIIKIIFGVIYWKQKCYIAKLDYFAFVGAIRTQSLLYDLKIAFPKIIF